MKFSLATKPIRKHAVMKYIGQKKWTIVEKWNGTLTQWLFLRGSWGYYVLKPSRLNSRLGRREPQTIHQMTMLHSVETSIARSHLERVGRGRKRWTKIQTGMLLVHFSQLQVFKKANDPLNWAKHFLLFYCYNSHATISCRKFYPCVTWDQLKLGFLRTGNNPTSAFNSKESLLHYLKEKQILK